MRRFLLTAHMLVGLVFGAYAIVLGVSGSILVYRGELAAFEFPKFYEGDFWQVLGANPDDALAAVTAVYPGWQAYSLTWPNSASPHYMAYISKGSESMEVFVNAMSGRVIGGRGTRDGFIGNVAQLHFNLLLGRTGRTIQGVGVFALLAMCASGLWLWWPAGGTRLASRFRLSLGGGWRKVAWQFHHVTGASSLIFVAMWAVTGGYYLWLNPYISLVDRFFERAKTPSVEARADSGVLSMADLARIAQAEFPGDPVYRMSKPAPGQAVSVTLSEATPAEFHRVATVFLDPVTGAVLQKGGSSDRPAGNSILGWISVLHFGRLGGPLLQVVRAIWAIMGLALPMLAITGALMWWRRVVEPRLRRSGERELVSK